MFFLIILYILLWTPYTAFSADINYETCKEGNWIDKVVKQANQFQVDQSERDTEANDCSDCSEQRHKGPHSRSSSEEVENLNNIAHTMEIPPGCFYAATLRGKGLSNARHYSCQTKNTENPTPTGERPCLNKEYSDMTAKAFNTVADCFGFLPHEKQHIFALFNHESRFILNARSPTRARCYGQMTMPLIKDINSNIYYRNRGYRFGDIYTEATNKCPGLKDKVVPQTIIDQQLRSDARLKRLQRNAPITCNMTHDPYTCLFYSMYNMKINMRYFNENYQEVPQYMGTRELSKQMEEDFPVPIRLNEMLVVKGKVKKAGKEEEVEWVFWDTSEVHSVFSKVEEYDIKNLEVRKTKLFDEKTLKTAFLHYAHNGGNSVVKTHLKVFVEKTKKVISRGSSCSKNKECSKRRTSMIEGKPLNISELQSLFSSYVDNNNLENEEELMQFTDKIERDIDSIHDKASREVKEGEEKIGWNDLELKKEVKEKCPTKEDIYSYD